MGSDACSSMCTVCQDVEIVVWHYGCSYGWPMRVRLCHGMRLLAILWFVACLEGALLSSSTSENAHLCTVAAG